ncbi:RidA family protein [Ruegeria sp. YS9]|uniref:RidA family protein n=1 Tax=Ruegeria sp. YS9 TaxID=2966453 RepID=UPI00214D0866|nr:RidA family protein [Ruegeria sp. YS9]UUV04820.1 RidA family protein [Ruegeria sp. YS9]
MGKTPLIPHALLGAPGQLSISPGVISGGHVFLTGMTGSAADGSMPYDPELQFRNAFSKIAEVLKEANQGLETVVEMTTYHVDMRKHFDLFDRVRLEVLPAPYPAWTAVEVAGLRREGALVEIRAIAHLSE